MDAPVPHTFHLSIQKEANKQNDSSLQTQVNALLFGGNKEKDYKWVTSFLGLMHSISMSEK